MYHTLQELKYVESINFLTSQYIWHKLLEIVRLINFLSVCEVSEEQFSQVYLLFSSFLPACQCDKKGHNFQSSNVPTEV